VSGGQFDIAIVGGGMVGASLACALGAGGRGWRVALVESFPLLDRAGAAVCQPSFDARSTALSLSSARFLGRLGLWEAVRRHAQPIRRIHVSDRGRFGSVVMDAPAEGLEALGYVVENQWLGSVLHEGLRATTGLTLLAPARVDAVRVHAGRAELRVDAGHGAQPLGLEAALAVIADGARSGLAASLGIHAEQQAYGQQALIANIAHREPHAGQAFERFTDAGPLAMLPLSDAADGSARSALVWVQTPEAAAASHALAEDEFLRGLQARFGYRLGRLLRVGARHLYPLALTRAAEQVRSGVVLLGNAAHALHPVAGQGFNLSLRDVAALAEVLDAAHARGAGPGELEVLQRFVARQGVDQEGTIGFSDALPRIFGSGLLPLAAARDAGLIGLELWPAARSLLVRHATGLAGGGGTG
jgi:2-octaprenyl-6-methoxyphenol hydroxylase